MLESMVLAFLQQVGGLERLSAIELGGAEPYNRPPVVSSSIPQNYEVVRESPVGPVEPTPLGRNDIVVFHVRVADPDGDPVELQLVSIFEEIQLRRLGESLTDSLFEVRVRNRQIFANKFMEFPDELHFQAWDRRSPNVKVRFVQRFRHHMDIPSRLLVDATGDGTTDALLFVASGPAGALALFPGESLPASSPSFSGTPAPTADLATHNLRPLGEAFLADVTGDGRVDILAQSHCCASLPICVWPARSGMSGMTEPSLTLQSGLDPGRGAFVRVGDVTGNGLLDVVAAYFEATIDGDQFAGGVCIWSDIPNAEGSVERTALLANPDPFPINMLGRDMVWLVDLTGDGIVDIVPTTDNNDDSQTLVFAGGPALTGRPLPVAQLSVPGVRGRLQMVGLFAGQEAYDLFLIEWSAPRGGFAFVDPIPIPGTPLFLGM